MFKKILNYFGRNTNKESVFFGQDKNNAFLQEMGIKIERADFRGVSEHDHVLLQSKKHIAERAYILYLCYLVSIGQIDAKEAVYFIEAHQIFFKLTKKEYDFLYQSNQLSGIDFSWRIERIWILLWAIKKVDFPFYDLQSCCEQIITKVFFQNSILMEPNAFIKSCSELRVESDIKSLLDLYLRLNWYAVEKKLKGYEIQQFHDRIVYERLYTLQWITQNIDIEWDASKLDFLTNYN